MNLEKLKTGDSGPKELKHLHHEINNALFALNTASQKLSANQPDTHLAALNIKSAISKLEGLSRQLGDALKETKSKQVEGKA